MEEKIPFVRVSRRQDIKKSQVWLIRLIAFFVALLLGSLIFIICGVSPIEAYTTIVTGAFGKLTGFKQTVKITVSYTHLTLPTKA